MSVRYLLFLVVGCSGTAVADDSNPTSADQTTNPQLNWLDDYSTAYQQAEQKQRMLLVYFYRQNSGSAQNNFETGTLNDQQVRERLASYELVKLPVDRPVTIDGKQVDLLRHSSFAHMNGSAGLAIVDLKHKDQPYFRRAVSCLPFEPPVYYVSSYDSPKSVNILLDLPRGTITQRTMIYAVRMHPERPASTEGTVNSVLLEECQQHSSHQARIRRQGHHNWESRFHRIWGQVGGKHPSEVCAESWPGKGLLAASIDCVHSWRQSAGHWNSVRSPQPAYGYDIRQGSNGIWYATGIFGG